MSFGYGRSFGVPSRGSFGGMFRNQRGGPGVDPRGLAGQRWPWLDPERAGGGGGWFGNWGKDALQVAGQFGAGVSDWMGNKAKLDLDREMFERTQALEEEKYRTSEEDKRRQREAWGAMFRSQYGGG